MFSLGKRILGISYEESKEENINVVEEEVLIKEENSDFESEDEKAIDFLDCLIFENNSVKYYKTDVKKFINNIEIWCGQRQLEKEHVMSLARQFTREEHVMGTFKLVRSNTNNIRLIDGQHRYFALKEIIKIQPNFNCDIIIELYDTDTLESKNTLRLFEKANNVLNVKSEDTPNKSALAIVEKLSITVTICLAETRRSHKCEPIKPAPPVTRILITVS